MRWRWKCQKIKSKIHQMMMMLTVDVFVTEFHQKNIKNKLLSFLQWIFFISFTVESGVIKRKLSSSVVFFYLMMPVNGEERRKSHFFSDSMSREIFSFLFYIHSLPLKLKTWKERMSTMLGEMWGYYDCLINDDSTTRHGFIIKLVYVFIFN